MNEVRVGRLPPAATLGLAVAGWYLIATAWLTGLPFVLGPLLTLLATLSTHVVAAAALNSVAAVGSFGALGVLIGRMRFGGLLLALDAPWQWGAIVRKGWPYAVVFAGHAAVVTFSPPTQALISAFAAAEGVPPGLAAFSAVGLELLWHVPVVGACIFVLFCFLSQIGDA